MFAALDAPAATITGGVVPVLEPAGGFAIDGDLRANWSTTGIGDWVPGFEGEGGNLLTAAGVPLDASATFHLVDAFRTSPDNILGSGKYFDDPNTWTWSMGSANAKTDINHALIHFTTDLSGNQWVIIAGDRMSDNGTSWIDFEFLQNTLTANPDGTFTSAGPHGGRTTNDFLLTVSLTSGGSVAGFSVEQWKAAGTGYDYMPADLARLVSAGAVYAAANSANGTPVSYGAFGETTYLQNTFVEAAINLTDMISDIFDPCTTIGVKTIVVKTKTSAARSANLADFLMPLNVDLTIGVADAGENQAQCAAGESTGFNLLGTSNPGTNQVQNMSWSVLAGSATLSSPASCDSCTSLPVTANVTSATALLRLTVVLETGCSVTDDVLLTVMPEPPCEITLNSPLVAGQTTSVTGPPGDLSYHWTVAYDNGPADFMETGRGTIEIPIPLEAAGTITIGLTVTSSNGCSHTCYLVENILPPPCTASDNPGGCPGIPQTFALNENSYPVNSTVDWSFTDNNGGAWFVAGNTGFVVHINATNSAWFSIEATIFLDGLAIDTCSTFGSFVDTEAPVILAIPQGTYLGCNPETPPTADSVAQQVMAADNCVDPTIEVAFADALTGCVMSRTFTITARDLAGNVSASAHVVYTWTEDTAPPAVVCPAGKTVECGTSWNFDPPATAADGCGAVTVVVSSTTTNAVDHCGGTFTATRTWTITDPCLNSLTCSQVVTVVDSTAPAFTFVPAPETIHCPATAVFGIPTAMDGCSGTVTIRVAGEDVILETDCPGAYTVTRQWIATDDCGNETAASQTITVECESITILDQPQDTAICEGMPVLLSVTAPPATPHFYQWRKNSIPIAGATTSDFFMEAVSADSLGDYDVVLSNPCGSITSAVARVTLHLNTASGALANLVRCPGENATFNTVASGSGPFNYVWRKNGVLLSGQTGGTLLLPQVTAADAGTYSVEVTGLCNAVTNAATLDIATSSSASPLVSQRVCTGANPTFSTIPTGSGPFSYVWRAGSQVLAGETNSVMTLRNVTAAQSGEISVEVTAACNTVRQSAILTVVPEVTANPLVLENPSVIVINDYGAATPYPSAIEVECVPGDIETVTVRLSGFSHEFGEDVQMLLVGPNGESVELMANCGGDYKIEDATLVFDDDAGQLLPQAAPILSGVYKPTVHGLASPFPEPAPTDRLSRLSGFQGVSANGTWGLYISDVQRLDLGGVEGGWSLSIQWRQEKAMQAPQLTGRLLQEDGAFRLVLSGEPNQPHVIEASTDLKTWVPISTNILESSLETFIDLDMDGSRQMFFRALRHQ